MVTTLFLWASESSRTSVPSEDLTQTEPACNGNPKWFVCSLKLEKDHPCVVDIAGAEL